MNDLFASAGVDSMASARDVVASLAAAFALGALVAGIYRWTRGAAAARSELMATLVLLSVLLCLATLVIGNNVARAFSIVGALSIVRFRTVVRDTRDTAFVIAAVTVGMAAGAGYVLAPLLALPVVFLAAVAFAPRQGGGVRHEVSVRTATGFDGVDAVRAAIGRHGADPELHSIVVAKGGDGELRRWSVTLSGGDGAEAVLRAVRAVPGVLSAEVSRA